MKDARVLRYGLAVLTAVALLSGRSAAWSQGYPAGIPPGRIAPSGIMQGDSVASAADRARRRMEADTAIRQQDLAVRTRQQRAIERDRAALDAARGQRGGSAPATPEQWQREQALRNDIDRRIAVQRQGVTVTSTGPGAWIMRDGAGATQGVCREIGGVLTC
ncbi:hypothetical protein [Gluconacetobacter takamatsuzukensis]|uniref:Uncharacterized protein n=1 Tax=Gluconacetobacter takamatsuzukensis TaxID=1286190 RepID=A0A7W4KFX1_9PROT|nr:hypothetical protein [Gluconacetobacter takamatsuzukensis]MBB2206174.1 hypothetical protein [Gluconacetobacter takamatsuzukensis]